MPIYLSNPTISLPVEEDWTAGFVKIGNSAVVGVSPVFWPEFQISASLIEKTEDSSTSQPIKPGSVKFDQINDLKQLVKELYPERANLLFDLINCESGFNEFAFNENDPNGGSKGLLQFQEPTFYRFAEILKIENPDIWNTKQQLKVADYMLFQDLGYHWTCWKSNY